MKQIFTILGLSAAMFANAQTTVNFNVGAQGYVGGSEIKTGTIDANISFTTDKGSTNNFPTYYAPSGNFPAQLRVYSVRASGDGNTITFTPAAGKTIKSLVINATEAQYAPAVTYSVNGGSFQAATLDGTTYTISNIDADANLTIKNAHTGGTSNTQLRFTTLAVVYDNVLAVGDVNGTKASLVKNTIVSNEIIFGEAAKVTVTNMAGQVVKTAEVAKDATLNVSSLATGTYIVTGTVNGKAVSQKIIKK